MSTRKPVQQCEAYWQNARSRGRRCTAPAEHIVGGHHVCWVHAQACRNPDRTRPVSFTEEDARR